MQLLSAAIAGFDRTMQIHAGEGQLLTSPLYAQNCYNNQSCNVKYLHSLIELYGTDATFIFQYLQLLIERYGITATFYQYSGN